MYKRLYITLVENSCRCSSGIYSRANFVLIYINDIINGIKSNIRLFADDTSLFKIVECPITAALELNLNLKLLYTWASRWLVKFNPLKFASLIISKTRTKPQHPPLIMGNTTISEVTQHKHLGLVFLNDATWTNHIAGNSSESMDANWLFKTK